MADASFSGVTLIAALRCHVRLVSRLRIDASLFAPAPPRRLGRWAARGGQGKWAARG